MSDEYLRELYRQGAAAWPTLAVAEEPFVAHVRRAASSQLERREPRLRADDLYLACACASGSEGAIEAFEERFGPEIDITLRRNAESREARDEVRQMVRTRLFAHADGAKIAAYAGEAPLAYWVRLVALRTARNFQRQERTRLKDCSSDEGLLCSAVEPRSPDGIVMGAQLMGLYKTAFESAVASLSPREKTLLRLYVVDGLSIDELARLLHMHRATAARKVASARQRLAQETRSKVVELAKLGDDEIDIAFGMIASQLELSVERVFAEGDTLAPFDAPS